MSRDDNRARALQPRDALASRKAAQDWLQAKFDPYSKPQCELPMQVQHGRTLCRHCRLGYEKCCNRYKRDRRTEKKPQSAPSKGKETLDEDHKPDNCRSVFECSPVRSDRYKVGDGRHRRRN